MPIYEYKCNACGHFLEALQKISDAPLQQCPECGKPELAKQVSASAFRLGGSGWYETDFKSNNKKNLAGDAAKPESGGKGSTSGEAAKSESPAKAASAETSKPASQSAKQG